MLRGIPLSMTTSAVGFVLPICGCDRSWLRFAHSPHRLASWVRFAKSVLRHPRWVRFAECAVECHPTSPRSVHLLVRPAPIQPQLLLQRLRPAAPAFRPRRQIPPASPAARAVGDTPREAHGRSAARKAPVVQSAAGCTNRITRRRVPRRAWPLPAGCARPSASCRGRLRGEPPCRFAARARGPRTPTVPLPPARSAAAAR